MKIEKDLLEYNGMWAKKGKGNKCDSFTMADLKQLLSQQKEDIKKILIAHSFIGKPVSITKLFKQIDKL